MLKVLLTHTPQTLRRYYGARAVAELRALADLRLHDGDDALTPAELVAAAGDVDVIIADRLTTGPAVVFAGLPRLKAFLRCAVDIRNIDVAAASAAGVLVTRATPGFNTSVSELAIGYMIDLSRSISRTAADYQAGRAPEARMGRELSGGTLGIIGYGGIGRHLASIAAALGMVVLIADPYARIEDPRFSGVTMEDLLARSDYVVCLAGATNETENLIDATALGRMQPTAFFLNLSRGNLVDEAALTAALVEGRIAGAALDVGRAADQMPTPAVARLPNVVATPHVGGLTPPAIEHQAFDTVHQVAALVRGELPPGAVNSEHWTRRV
ncbi:MAG: NAD(P)-dependent oxidoreductase [Acetobacteraceae bacterium]|nr:NAD(P)-dependent oxidoreductase [Acetobacteraceae bacterium]